MDYYFECSIRYDKTLENGLIKKVTEKYLVQAMSFTEAEARFTKEMTPYISGNFDITAIKRLNIDTLFESKEQGADRWYRSKLTFTTIDERSGVEKRTPRIVYIRAKDLDDARNTIQDGMKGSLGDWEKTSVQETAIMDLFRAKSEA